MIIIGFFTLDAPVMHLIGAQLILATPVISLLVTRLHARRLPGWHALANGLLIAAPLTLVLFIVYIQTFNQADVAAGHGVAGLTQRVLFVEAFAWFVAMGGTPIAAQDQQQQQPAITEPTHWRKRYDPHPYEMHR